MMDTYNLCDFSGGMGFQTSCPNPSGSTHGHLPFISAPLFEAETNNNEIYTHYHNSNLIWRTVSRRVDEVILSDHPRRIASRVIQWYGLIHKT